VVFIFHFRQHNALILYSFICGKPEGKRPLGRHRHRWEDNISVDIRKIGLEGTDLMHLAQDRDQWWALVNRVVNLGVP